MQRRQTLAARHTEGESASEIPSQARRANAGFRNAGVCWKSEFRDCVKAFLQGKGQDLAAGKAPITRVVVKADHDTRGQLHEATNYGVICEAPGKPGHYVVRDHVALTGLTAKQIEEARRDRRQEADGGTDRNAPRPRKDQGAESGTYRRIRRVQNRDRSCRKGGPDRCAHLVGRRQARSILAQSRQGCCGIAGEPPETDG